LVPVAPSARSHGRDSSSDRKEVRDIGKIP
jgi:hypothetical protein